MFTTPLLTINGVGPRNQPIRAGRHAGHIVTTESTVPDHGLEVEGPAYELVLQVALPLTVGQAEGPGQPVDEGKEPVGDGLVLTSRGFWNVKSFSLNILERNEKLNILT